MSAIGGIVRLDGGRVKRSVLERMEASLEPYGRDARSCWLRGEAGLLRTLCRITPEDYFDRQPSTGGNGRLVVVFDGRLDNREELAEKLGLSTRQLGTMADSEVAFVACRQWDAEAVGRMVGNFAIACWRPEERRLWLARDPLGQRPLYWYRQADFFAFATMPKGLFAVPGIPRQLCERRLAEFLALLPMVGPESFFSDVFRVEPGQVLTLREGRVTTNRYHRWDPRREVRFSSDDEYVEAFGEHLERAIASRLRSAGPVASHLSSGFDSSTVTALAARQLAVRGERLLAYTAAPREGFVARLPKGRHADETPGAEAVASRFPNIEHLVVRSDGRSPVDGLNSRTEAGDRPLLGVAKQGWSETILEDARRRGVKVLLSGSAGNMSISYTGEYYLPALLKKGRFIRWWREAGAIKRTHPNRGWRWILLRSLGAYLPGALWVQYKKRFDGRSFRLTDYSPIRPEFMVRMGVAERAKALGWDLSYRPRTDGRRMRIDAITRADHGDYFAEVCQRTGIEMRDPTADLKLIEFCLAVPDDQFLRNGQDRWLLRRFMGEVLPAEILDSPSKGAQGVDWYEGAHASLPQLREELAAMVEHGTIADYLDVESLLDDFERWPEDGRVHGGLVETYQLKLFRGLAAGHFIRYVDQSNR